MLFTLVEDISKWLAVFFCLYPQPLQLFKMQNPGITSRWYEDW